MRTALLAPDVPTASVLQTLLERTGLVVRPFKASDGDPGLEERISVLREDFDEVLFVGAEKAPAGARALHMEPSLEAWLTRDAKANREVLGTDEVPEAEDAERWLQEQPIEGGRRRFSLSLDGRALASKLDLGVLLAFAPVLRALLSSLRPTWANEQPMQRAAGRPPGVALFRGTGYAFCLELLHRGTKAEVTVAQMMEALSRTKTPVLRLMQEALRRGYLRRTSPRGPLVVRNIERLLGDIVVDVKARRANHPENTRALSADRDSKGLAARIHRRFAEHGRAFALTGSSAVKALGGDRLVGAPTLAYTGLAGVSDLLADAFDDPTSPQLILIEPREEAVFHRMETGKPSVVSPWQAAIDLLSSPNDREREVGMEVKRQLLEGPR